MEERTVRYNLFAYTITPFLNIWGIDRFTNDSLFAHHRFYDLVRWQIAKPYLNTYLAKEKTFHPILQAASFAANHNEYLAIPESEITNSSVNGHPTLTQNPGY